MHMSNGFNANSSPTQSRVLVGLILVNSESVGSNGLFIYKWYKLKKNNYMGKTLKK